MAQKKVQSRKNMDLNKGFGITEEDISRCVECPHVIDCSKGYTKFKK